MIKDHYEVLDIKCPKCGKNITYSWNKCYYFRCNTMYDHYLVVIGCMPCWRALQARIQVLATLSEDQVAEFYEEHKMLMIKDWEEYDFEKQEGGMSE